MKKKLFALLLCFAMIVSVSVPIALANTGDELTDPPSDTQAPTVTPASSVTPELSATPSADPAASATPAPETTPAPEATLTPTPALTPDLAEMATALYEQLMACPILAGLESILAGFAEAGADVDALLAAFTDAQRAAYEEHRARLETLAAFIPPVNFTKAAAFMPPVKGASLRRGFALNSGPDPAEALKLSKTAAANGDGSYTLTLEAYTTGTVTNTVTNIPADIVLVLDESGSMDDSFGLAYDPVLGEKYTHGQNTYYGFDSSSSSYFIKLENGSYQLVTTRTRDGHNFDYYRYGPAGSPTYVYPKLNQDPTSVFRARDDWDVVQFYTYRTITNSRALTLSALAFSDAVKEKAQENNVDHRIAVVGFSSQSRLYLGSNGIQSPTTADYKAAFQDMRTTDGVANVEASIENLMSSGSTYIERGIDKANAIFLNNTIPAGTQRNRVVIVFTDGEPSGTYNDPIVSARTAKQTYGATVYTIGIFSGANVGEPASLPSSGANRFMHLLSSNYPTASGMNDTGSINPNLNGKSYYLAANNTSALNSIFEQISGQITAPAIELDEETVIKDVISNSFEMPAGAVVHLYTSNRQADGTFAARTAAPSAVTWTKSTDGKTIFVTGFDFDENFVSETARTEPGNPSNTNFYGRKIIIEFIVQTRAGFLGGNNVPTNDAGSGVYDGETVVGEFEVPHANIAIPPVAVVLAQDKNVYLYGGLTGSQLRADARVMAKADLDDADEDAIATINLGELVENYGLQTYQNEYVTIAWTFTKAGVAVTSLSDLTEDCSCLLTVKISPKDATSQGNSIGSPATEVTGEDVMNVRVFKPELTFRDSTVWYGDTAPVSPGGYAYNFVSPAIWKHGATLDSGVTMTGAKPDLVLTYAPEAGIADNKIAAKRDIPVDVTVKIGGTNVTDKTGFVHQACSPACAWTAPAVPGSPAFLLHVKTCRLTIQKTGGAANEPYVFNIKRNDAAYMTVSITTNGSGSGSTTIYELPVGTYTVTEEDEWSWRYEGSAAGSASLESANWSDTLACANTRKTTSPWFKWLNGYSLTAINRYSPPAGN